MDWLVEPVAGDCADYMDYLQSASLSKAIIDQKLGITRDTWGAGLAEPENYSHTKPSAAVLTYIEHGNRIGNDPVHLRACQF